MQIETFPDNSAIRKARRPVKGGDTCACCKGRVIPSCNRNGLAQVEVEILIEHNSLALDRLPVYSRCIGVADRVEIDRRLPGDSYRPG